MISFPFALDPHEDLFKKPLHLTELNQIPQKHLRILENLKAPILVHCDALDFKTVFIAC